MFTNRLPILPYLFYFLALASIAMALFGCSYQKSEWKEDSDGKFSYYQTNITPPFGKQSESAGQMNVTVLEDESWELAIGRTEKGVDNTAQAEMLKTVNGLIGLFSALQTGGLQ